MSSFYPIAPHDIAEELKNVSFSWWICGGWALELFTGHEIREHHDMDLAIFRKDQQMLREQLPDWEFKIALNGVLHEWGEGEMDKNLHALWARKKGQDKWVTEFLLNEADEINWIFRKNSKITFPLNEIGIKREKIPFLIPEIPLLFKSAHCGDKDELDFKHCIEKMNEVQKERLRKWISEFKPDCEWITKIDKAN
jgi:hypothetical protein